MCQRKGVPQGHPKVRITELNSPLVCFIPAAQSTSGVSAPTPDPYFILKTQGSSFAPIWDNLPLIWGDRWSDQQFGRTFAPKPENFSPKVEELCPQGQLSSVEEGDLEDCGEKDFVMAVTVHDGGKLEIFDDAGRLTETYSADEVFDAYGMIAPKEQIPEL